MSIHEINNACEMAAKGIGRMAGRSGVAAAEN